jgi:hypothetical protein
MKGIANKRMKMHMERLHQLSEKEHQVSQLHWGTFLVDEVCSSTNLL